MCSPGCNGPSPLGLAVSGEMTQRSSMVQPRLLPYPQGSQCTSVCHCQAAAKMRTVHSRFGPWPLLPQSPCSTAKNCCLRTLLSLCTAGRPTRSRSLQHELAAMDDACEAAVVQAALAERGQTVLGAAVQLLRQSLDPARASSDAARCIVS